MFETRWQCAQWYFLRKILNKISVERLTFCKSDTSLQLKQEKFPIKARQNRAVTTPPKPLVTIGELQCDLCQHQKWLVKQKSLILTTGLSMSTEGKFRFLQKTSWFGILKHVNASKYFAFFYCKNNFICIGSWKSVKGWKSKSKFEET